MSVCKLGLFIIFYRGYEDRSERLGYGRERGYGGRESSREEDEYRHRLQLANRRMEEASSQSLRTLHDCLRMGSDTAVELDRQAEALDRTERRLDEMHVDLDQSKRNLRLIKSPFGGVANYFARRKSAKEITDPKLPKSQSKSSQSSRSSSGSSRAAPPPMASMKSTGNETVDQNCEHMSKALHQLKGMGELIGQQLDDSEAQIDRIHFKLDRTDVKVNKLNKDIKRQL